MPQAVDATLANYTQGTRWLLFFLAAELSLAAPTAYALHGEPDESLPLLPLERVSEPPLPRPIFKDGAVDVHATRLKFEELEQQCIPGAPSRVAPLIESQRRKMLALLATAEPDNRRAGLTASLPPEEWNYESWDREAKSTWLRRINDADEKERCRLVELAYLFAVGQVSTLEPTRPVAGFADILLHKEEANRPDVVLDRRRAAWAFRYLHVLDRNDIPKTCRDVFDEGAKRRRFIFTPRRPLGFAYGMCGRPMNAHYLDDEVDQEKRPVPAGWTGPPRK